ncbi:SLC13 family permease [Pseudoflavonifractor phocaeensis]|uniref:SLC13 family permease n=1 Tax=Pseudoflavonifractor phocaeensis TaxID=1870988 RepID=UPI0025A4CC2F|nr:SLC13 family permease [Pseudoflavonifractor phocaeensis]MDM8240138.1 SLC13 family permease [Pseudoflavonifractor phocaeensis]
MTSTHSLWQFLRREPVLSISFVCALVSAFFVPPSAAYLDYIDLRVLCLLFCLMAVVAGLQECGLFLVLAQRLLVGERPVRLISLTLILLPFFCSMLVTNDVALITFVPFAILVLEMVGRRDLLIPIISLQTVAANLGSMATPVGNPQNLFLYAHFSLSMGDFLSLLLPLTLISLVGLAAAGLYFGGKGWISVSFPEQVRLTSPKHLALYLVLFGLCLLSVCRILPYGILTVIVIVALLLARRQLLGQVDYMLLLTFVCFFIFSGNLGQMPAVRSALGDLLARSPLLCSAAASQVISNVPAAVLLSGLTEDWKGLLAGVDVGGLGTPVASLASLISMKFYLRSREAKPLPYFLWFTAANVVGLLVLLPVAARLVH